MFTHENIALHWLGHDGFLIEGNGMTICIDPFKVASAKPADFILITHEHHDHLSLEDIRKFLKEETLVICPKGCEAALKGMPRILTLHPGQEIPLGEATLRAIPAYNTNKFRDPVTKTVFHPKTDGKLGYGLEIGGTTIYHAGDTDHIPEMDDLQPTIALLPVSGTYVMTAEEAAEAAKAIRPKIAIPMHYGTIVGTEDDAVRFKQLLEESDIKVEILKPE